MEATVKGSNRGRRQQPRTSSGSQRRRKILLLHGNRQTGQLLLGRMDRLRKRLLKTGVELVAPDAPFVHPEDSQLRQWWDRHDNEYHGLDETMSLLKNLWEQHDFEGIFGFSQGARLAHLMAVSHVHNNQKFAGLKYIILVSGYDAPMPDGFQKLCPQVDMQQQIVSVSSLHVWGQNDALITPDQSRAVLELYQSPQIHEHNGKHFVPMKAPNVDAYIQFIDSVMTTTAPPQENTTRDQETVAAAPEKLEVTVPDDETLQVQQDEVEALSAIFPEEFQLLSLQDGEEYQHPISYRIDLPESDVGVWPPHPISLVVEYPPTYPQDVMAHIRLDHENNMMEFTSSQTEAVLTALKEAAQAELGMPSVLACVYAAREFFESGLMTTASKNQDALEESVENEVPQNRPEEAENEEPKASMLKTASKERIQECNLQGLEIAKSLLNNTLSSQNRHQETPSDATLVGKGGLWKYCIGLVGKPSAGKSTLFNAATAFARQRGDSTGDNGVGGATMAPHPFTTIDPNVGYCLVPAPPGSCPEDDDNFNVKIGSTHGRDDKGQRLLPVMLKDVAGLVPGAYQGRGRGNKFLNDLTDADVLVHVVDASGTADTEGNTVGCTDRDTTGAGSHPLNDLAWIGDELIQWVFSNLLFKWQIISRRGRSKLEGMFSGYGQNQALLWDILLGVERYMDETEHRDHALDRLEEWDEGDVHRLVSTFLGVRFPMALALNKSDLPPAATYIRDVQEALPSHGAHIGVPLCARSEMSFVRQHLGKMDGSSTGEIPTGVWMCLQSAMSLREPILAFPVADMTTYTSLPGMLNYATGDASLPSSAMISCLRAAGGSAPSLWNDEREAYSADNDQTDSILRDVLVMKPGSTVEDAFLALKRLGALGGEFVRAEGAGQIGEKPKLIPKNELIGKTNRILKIMTNKRRDWQN